MAKRYIFGTFMIVSVLTATVLLFLNTMTF